MEQVRKLYGRRFVQLFLLSAVLLLSACGSKSKLDGTYADRDLPISYTFESNGKVTMSVDGREYEMNYEVDGNKIKIGGPAGARVMTLLEDGSIQDKGFKLTKQKK